MNGGLLVLNGGDEFRPGNEPQDELLVEAAGHGPAYIVPTAAARQAPERAVATATAWFARLGLEVVELPLLTRRSASDPALVAAAGRGRMFYLVGGDPGLVVQVLKDTPAWSAVVEAWQAGAALAGSSAGAMALGGWTLVMERWPHHERRRPVEALGLVPRVAVVPHFEKFGGRWTFDGDALAVGLDERTAAVHDGTAWRAYGAGSVTVGGGRFSGGAVVAGIPEPGPGGPADG